MVNEAPLWPLAVYFLVVFVVVGAILLISYLLGQRHREPATGQPYESGIDRTGSARVRLDIKFYLNAVFFVVFDLEAAFIFAYALTVRELGWAGYLEILVFIGVLLAALVYLWRLGALDWAHGRRQR
ncbi:MAG: NADH-quinone oxidoreductase subunit A [Chloroflexota bacterium]